MAEQGTCSTQPNRGRWYLKETADHVDQAEQNKEDVSPRGWGSPWLRGSSEQPEQEGVHYSDLFEQYLPVRESRAACWPTGCRNTSSRRPAAPGVRPIRAKPTSSAGSVRQVRCGESNGLPTP